MKLSELLSKKGRKYFYIMHLSYDGREKERLWKYAKKNKVIGLSHTAVKGEWNRVKDSVTEYLPVWRRQFEMFCNEMAIGDIVMVLEGWHSLLGIAEVRDGHRYNRRLRGIFFNHTRPVKWIKEHDFSNRPRLPYPVTGFTNTLHKVKPGTRRWQILSTIGC